MKSFLAFFFLIAFSRPSLAGQEICVSAISHDTPEWREVEAQYEDKRNDFNFLAGSKLTRVNTQQTPAANPALDYLGFVNISGVPFAPAYARTIFEQFNLRVAEQINAGIISSDEALFLGLIYTRRNDNGLLDYSFPRPGIDDLPNDRLPVRKWVLASEKKDLINAAYSLAMASGVLVCDLGYIDHEILGHAAQIIQKPRYAAAIRRFYNKLILQDVSTQNILHHRAFVFNEFLTLPDINKAEQIYAALNASGFDEANGSLETARAQLLGLFARDKKLAIQQMLDFVERAEALVVKYGGGHNDGYNFKKRALTQDAELARLGLDVRLDLMVRDEYILKDDLWTHIIDAKKLLNELKLPKPGRSLVKGSIYTFIPNGRLQKLVFNSAIKALAKIQVGLYWGIKLGVDGALYVTDSGEIDFSGQNRTAQYILQTADKDSYQYRMFYDRSHYTKPTLRPPKKARHWLRISIK